MSDLYEADFYAWANEQAALLAAQRETGLPAASFPASCPWTFDQAMQEEQDGPDDHR